MTNRADPRTRSEEAEGKGMVGMEKQPDTLVTGIVREILEKNTNGNSGSAYQFIKLSISVYLGSLLIAL